MWTFIAGHLGIAVVGGVEYPLNRLPNHKRLAEHESSSAGSPFGTTLDIYVRVVPTDAYSLSARPGAVYFLRSKCVAELQRSPLDLW